MNALSKKIYLQLPKPTDTDMRGDKERIISSLPEEYTPAYMSYRVLKELYPVCRESDWCITLTLVYQLEKWEIIKIESGDTTDKLYGFAVDLGSTTVAMQAVDLLSGEVLAEETLFNQQIEFGQDILSRIFSVQEKPENLAKIQSVTVKTFSHLIVDLCRKVNLSAEDFSIMVIAGNTTMIHFLLGINPWPVFQTPFCPVFNAPDFIEASQLFLPFSGMVYCFPSVANYLGGDIISGLLLADLQKEKQSAIFIDIGTNGEIVLSYDGLLLAAAGAAGPALEGGVSQSGMRATAGAVDTVLIDNGVLKLTTIDNEKPKGICGSGIVDLLAQLFLNGIIDFSGKFIPDSSDRVIKRNGQYVFVYAWEDESYNGDMLIFTQIDINQFLDTKAAAHTMVAFLLDALSLDLSKVDKFYTAGAFGKYLNLESAITIGLYPDLPRDKFVSLGNSSLQGAYMLLTDRNLLAKVKNIQESIEYLQLGSADNYLTLMIAAKFLPHTNLEIYPSVKADLIKRGILK